MDHLAIDLHLVTARVESFSGVVWWAGPMEGSSPPPVPTLDENRWNETGQETVYLAGDAGLALIECGRHAADPAGPIGIWRLSARIRAVLDLGNASMRNALGLVRSGWLYDTVACQRAASGLRMLGVCDALQVPSAGLPDVPARANLVVIRGADGRRVSFDDAQLAFVVAGAEEVSDRPRRVSKSA